MSACAFNPGRRHAVGRERGQAADVAIVNHISRYGRRRIYVKKRPASETASRPLSEIRRTSEQSEFSDHFATLQGNKSNQCCARHVFAQKSNGSVGQQCLNTTRVE